MEEWIQSWSLIRGSVPEGNPIEGQPETDEVAELGDKIGQLVRAMQGIKQQLSRPQGRQVAAIEPSEFVSGMAQTGTETSDGTLDQSCGTEPLWLVVRKVTGEQDSGDTLELEIGNNDNSPRATKEGEIQSECRIVPSSRPASTSIISRADFQTFASTVRFSSSQTAPPPTTASTSSETTLVSTSESSIQVHSLKDLQLLSEKSCGDPIKVHSAGISTEEVRVRTEGTDTEPSMEVGWVERSVHEVGLILSSLLCCAN
jgi:hypothetical protein